MSNLNVLLLSILGGNGPCWSIATVVGGGAEIRPDKHKNDGGEETERFSTKSAATLDEIEELLELDDDEFNPPDEVPVPPTTEAKVVVDEEFVLLEEPPEVVVDDLMIPFDGHE
jgi:hypothetical protein